MKQNQAIRVIKSAARGGQSDNPRNPVTDDESLRPSAPRVTSQVASWVKEFQQRRHPDPRRAFASLVADPATPINSLS